MIYNDDIKVTLLNSISESSTTINVSNPTGIYNDPINPSGQAVTLKIVDRISNPSRREIITYTGRSSITGGYALTGVTRGVSSTAVPWAAGCFAVSVVTESVNLLDIANTWTKGQSSQQYNLTSSGGAIALDLSQSNQFIHTLTENTTLSNPTNATAGYEGKIVFVQNGAAAKTLSLDSGYVTNDGSSFAIPTTLSALAVLYFSVNRLSPLHITATLINHGVT